MDNTRWEDAKEALEACTGYAANSAGILSDEVYAKEETLRLCRQLLDEAGRP